MKSCLKTLLLLMAAGAAHAEDGARLLAAVERQSAPFIAAAMDIWNYAELGYLENKSSARLQQLMADNGFEVQAGVAGIPTAFVASYGEGSPVIGILAEFDALPGISQTASPTREIFEGRSSGHACGHHLFGAGSAQAAVAVRHWMAENDMAGEIRLYGTPAEEGGSGKVYLVRAGLFDDVDMVLHWHPSSRNSAHAASSLANRSARFRYSGVSSHASAAPERGRSALDGVEAMNYMVNLLREHVPQETRIHYVITKGGEAPNVVPDHAEVYYYVRHPDAEVLQTIWDRVMDASRAAALGTGTEVESEVMHGNHPLLPNEALARRMHANLTRVGGVTYNRQERAFAKRLSSTLPTGELVGAESEITPFRITRGGGSTDVGDVSWVVPTVGMRAATWVPGTASHSWQAIAAGGMSIGAKGMQVAAKSLALMARDLLLDESLRQAARDEFERRRGPDFEYRALLGDRSPPLDYRLN